jgi:prefoldin subunit 5
LEERIELLEQVQRDLEQDVADVAAKIARLRARAAEETTSAPESSAT